MIDLSQFPKAWQGHLQQTLEIWDQGGWAMWPLAVIALLMLTVSFRLMPLFGQVVWHWVVDGVAWSPARAWRRKVHNPRARSGRLGTLIARAEQETSVEGVQGHFERAIGNWIAPVKRDLKVLKICAAAAPLVGLLGTVTGMLLTFAGMSSGGGGSQTMARIAAGISEALVTTMTGLTIAIPGMLLHWLLRVGVLTYEGFLGHLEIIVVQRVRSERQRASQERLRTLVAKLLPKAREAS